MRPSLDLRLCDRPPTPPAWVVEGILERGGVAILSGDTGTCKSLVAVRLAVSIIRGEPWLGRRVEHGMVIYFDAELTQRLAVDRLRGLGVRSADRDRLDYRNRPGLDLGSPASVAELREIAGEAKPALIVIDTVMRCAPSIDVNNNTDVVALYAEVLGPLATELDAALLLLHHERKGAQGRGRDAKQAVLGAMQWVGQADTQLALALAPGRCYVPETTLDGGLRETFRVRMRTPKNRESGDRATAEPIIVQSERTREGALLWLTVEPDEVADRAELVESRADRDQARAEQMAAFLSDHGEARTAQIAAKLDVDPNSGSFRRPLNLAVKIGLVQKVRNGVYRSVEQ